MRVLDTTGYIQSTSSYIQIEHKGISSASELYSALLVKRYDRVVLRSALLRADAETTEIHSELLAVCAQCNVLVSYA